MDVWSIFVGRVCKFFAAIAGLFSCHYLLVTLADVVAGPLGNLFTGPMRLSQYMGAIRIGFSMPYTSFRKKPVFVESS